MNPTIPEEVVRALVEILRIGLLRIRGLGNAGNAAECSTEADHLHNIPFVLQSPSRDSVSFYWTVCRPAFLSATRCNIDQFGTPWEVVASYLTPRYPADE
jgi:hypothetical protein